MKITRGRKCEARGEHFDMNRDGKTPVYVGGGPRTEKTVGAVHR